MLACHSQNRAILMTLITYVYQYYQLFLEQIILTLEVNQMFRISRRLDYGLQLMIALAAETENRAQSTASLSKKLAIPLPFLHQIAHALMQTSYIKATPGPHGGLRLNQEAGKISVLNIVEALEGPISLNPCQDSPDQCESSENCAAQLVWNDLQAKIVDHMTSVSLEMLVQQPGLAAMYSIPAANFSRN